MIQYAIQNLGDIDVFQILHCAPVHDGYTCAVNSKFVARYGDPLLSRMQFAFIGDLMRRFL